MRIHVHDLQRPKAAARKLATFAPDTTQLSAVQHQLAVSLGYEDWHELQRQPKAPREPTLELSQKAGLVADLSKRLQILPGDVQFALSSSRLIGPTKLSEQLDLRAAVWRKLIGPPARNKPGSVVRDRAYGRGEFTYLRRFGPPSSLYGRAVELLFDTGPGLRGDFEVAQPRTAPPDFVPARLWLPYGCWTTRDGAEVLFSRDYLPLWRVSAQGVERLEPWLWVEHIESQRHFGRSVWSSGPPREAAIAALEERRLTGLPMLVDAMQILIETEVETVGEAVHQLMLERGAHRPARPGTSRNMRLK